MINLFFPYYQCGDKARQEEIDICLQKNIENPCIDRLMVMVDDGSTLPFMSAKVTRIDLHTRPTYQQWITLTKSYGLEGVSMLCNSDIYFDESIVKLRALLQQGERFLALSRWDLLNGAVSLHPNPHWSQDVWGIPCSADVSEGLFRQLDFQLGVPRCDNKIAYLFGVHGWAVFNPCREVRSIHVHETQLRTYDKKLDSRILGGVAYVNPSENNYTPSKLDMDVWVASSEHIASLKLNVTMEKWRSEAGVTSTALANVAVTDAGEIKLAEPSDALKAIKYGNIVERIQGAFIFHKESDSLYLRNNHEPLRMVELTGSQRTGTLDTMMVYFIPPVLDTWAASIGDKPESRSDLNFWQYPCATEKQAYTSHKNFGPFQHIDSENKIVNLYVPLPWATYIDKKSFSTTMLARVARVVSQYQALAKRSGYQLKVHSVCQHIRWVRIIEKACEIGITDLYLSHKTPESVKQLPDEYSNLRLHSWTLIAVNYELPERSRGMERVPMSQRNILASFIGAHMPHYLDDSRLKLYEAAKQTNRDDIVVDLGDTWHFNRHVYEEQVRHDPVETEFLAQHERKTFDYNRLMSNSKFSFCPPGAGPNTLRFWESIAVGTVPVLFDQELSIFNESEIGQKLLEASVIYGGDPDEELFAYLDSFSLDSLADKSNLLMELYEKARVLTIYDVGNCVE